MPTAAPRPDAATDGQPDKPGPAVGAVTTPVPRPGRRRGLLWTRIAIGWLLIVMMSCGIFWWPRRGCWAVLFWGGRLFPTNVSRAEKFAGSLPPYAAPLRSLIKRYPGLFLTDDEVAYAFTPPNPSAGNQLLNSASLFPKLINIRIPASSISPRLTRLADGGALQNLNRISLDNVDATTRIQPLLALPQLDGLEFWRSTDPPKDLAELSKLATFRSLSLENPRHPAQILEKLATCRQLERVHISHPDVSASEFVPRLSLISNLKHVTLRCPLTDDHLKTLSRLQTLESVELYFSNQPSPITLDGWRQLATLPHLKAMSYSDDPRTPAFTAEDAAEISRIFANQQFKHGSYATMGMPLPKPR